METEQQDTPEGEASQQQRRRIGWPTLALVAAVAVTVVIGMLAISGGEDPGPGTEPSTPPTAKPDAVRFGVWGSEAEIAAYQRVVDAWNQTSRDFDAKLLDWPDQEAMLAAIRGGKAAPDVYLLPRDELAATVAERRNRPVQDLLDARGISLGDDYSRNALEAFSANDDLQCMPYTSSPMVIYYNTALIDFETMAEQDLPVPREDDGRWTLDAFRAAAETATRPRQRTRGFSIESTLEGLAPFIYSGGGQVFDDAVAPTSLSLGEEGSVEALTTTLDVLRDSQLTLTKKQLRQRSAVEWFKAGKLGMVAGYRDLTPELRAAKGLEFDVLPMPQLGAAATVGDLNGLCIAAGAPLRVQRAADFLVHAVSNDSVTEVVKTGTIAPTNLPVSFSPAFLQPNQSPARSTVFTAMQSTIQLWPLLDSWSRLEQAAAPGLRRLTTAPVLSPQEIQEILDDIDEESRALLDPDYEPSGEESTGSAPAGSPPLTAAAD